MSDPDFFFSRPTASHVLFFEYSTKYSDFQSDLHEIYRPGLEAEHLSFGVAKTAIENQCDVISVTYDHPSRNPDLTAAVYFDLGGSKDPRQSMLEFALAMGYDATLEDIPELLNHKEAVLIGTGLFPNRGELAFHMVYKGEAEHFADIATIDPKYKNFAFQYVLTKEGTSNHAVEFFENFEEHGFSELDAHVAHCEAKAAEVYGDKVRLANICSYKFFLETDERKVYYRVLLHT